MHLDNISYSFELKFFWIVVLKMTVELHYITYKLEILLIVFRSLNVPGVGLFLFGEYDNYEYKELNVIFQ